MPLLLSISAIFNFAVTEPSATYDFCRVKSQAMTHEDVAAFRLARHRLMGRSGGIRRVDLRRRLRHSGAGDVGGGVALWTRNRSLRRTDVVDALWKRRSVVKTSAMRQTLHLLAAPDFPIYIAALKRSRLAALDRLLAKLKVTADEAAEMQRTIVDALADGPMTQQELTRRAHTKPSKHLKASLKYPWSAFRPSIIRGVICYGPPRGSEITLVRTDQWLGAGSDIDADDATRELVRRFLGSYGPATPRDFVKWSGIPMSEAKPVWDAVSGEMTEVIIENGIADAAPHAGARHVPGTGRAKSAAGRGKRAIGARHVPGTDGTGVTAWILKKDAGALRTAGEPRAVRLLPAFDVYLLAHSAKDHLIAPRFYKRVYRNQGWLSPVVLHGGRIVAVWFLRSNARIQVVDVEPFEPLSRAVKAGIEEEVGALSGFLNAPCQVLFGRD